MAKYKKRADGYYESKVSSGYDSNGKLKRKTVYAKSPRELERKIDELKLNMAHGYDPNAKAISLYSYAEHWYKTYKINKSINTKEMYSYVLKTIKNDDIGQTYLDKIKKSDIQALINKNNKYPRKCQQIALTLKQIFNSAIEDGLMIKNLANNIELPDRKHTGKRALTEKEKEAIKKAELSSMERAFINIIYSLGLRREEALALSKSSFNFKKKIVTINCATVFDSNKPIIDNTKTYFSNREVYIPNTFLNQIKEYVESINTFYLFTKNDGELMTLSSYNKMWSRIRSAINKKLCTEEELKIGANKVKDITAHMFRHNYATMLYYSNISIKEAARLMGHSNAKMIMDIYAHLDEEKENTKEKLNNVINL